MRPNLLRAALLLFLLAAFAGRIVLTYNVFNDTVDESGHIRAGLEIVQKGGYSIESQHPPVSRLVLGVLPYYFGRLHLNEHNQLWAYGSWTFSDPAAYWKSLGLARAGNLVFALIVFCFVYRWSSLLYGAWAGAAACLLAICCPTLVAHASLATIDMSSAATVLMAAYFFWRWSRRPGLRYCLASAAAFSFATLCKFSALAFLPPLAALYFLAARGKRWRREGRRLLTVASLRTAFAHGLVFGAAFLFFLWAGYLFQAEGHIPPGHAHTAAQHRLFPSMFTDGLRTLWLHNHEGHRGYLLGQISKYGWWYYFPVALAVKTTLPLLLLVGIGIALYASGRYAGLARQTLYPLLAVVVVLGVSMGASLNIGVRHVLAIYPFFAILGSGVFAASDRLLSPGRALLFIALSAAACHAGESILAHPDYLAYFNEIARGREERFLLDSNLDWGQDLARLGQYLQDHQISEVRLRYYGMTPPSKMGVNARDLPSGPPEKGWNAISINHLLGLEHDSPELQWFRDRRPAARVGKSIWLYYVP